MIGDFGFEIIRLEIFSFLNFLLLLLSVTIDRSIAIHFSFSYFHLENFLRDTGDRTDFRGYILWMKERTNDR